MRVEPVAPIGTELFRSYSCEWLVPVYPESPEADALRDLRVSRGVSVRDAAAACGLTAVEYGELERRKAQPMAPHTWADVRAAVLALRRWP